MTRRVYGGAAEQDVLTSWRHLYCYLSNRHGVAVRKIKRRANRRERHAARRALRRGDDD